MKVKAMKSLLAAINNVGMKLPINIPSSFQSCPSSTGMLIRVSELPNPGITDWVRLHTNFDDPVWTDEFQGIACAFELGYGIWFFSKKDKIFKVKWDPSGSSIEFLKEFNLQGLGANFDGFNHFCDLEYSNGIVFVPIENKDGSEPRILAFSAELDFMGWATLFGKDKNAGGCTINPWNKLLYVSDDDPISFFYNYDVTTIYNLARHRNLWPSEVRDLKLTNNRFYLKKANGINDQLKGDLQGVTFTPNGRIYISYTIGNGPWENYLACYNALTGRQLGHIEVEHPDSSSVGEELEGITFCKEMNTIYLVFLDNDYEFPPFSWTSKDEIDILHYQHQDPNHPL
jgi:hypothetical protein